MKIMLIQTKSYHNQVVKDLSNSFLSFLLSSIKLYERLLWLASFGIGLTSRKEIDFAIYAIWMDRSNFSGGYLNGFLHPWEPHIENRYVKTTRISH